MKQPCPRASPAQLRRPQTRPCCLALLGLLFAGAGWRTGQAELMASTGLLLTWFAVHVVCHCCHLLVVWQAQAELGTASVFCIAYQAECVALHMMA